MRPEESCGCEGVPGEIVRIIVEQRPGRLLDLFNSISRSDRIPAVWRVVLLPNPARVPLLSDKHSAGSE